MTICLQLAKQGMGKVSPNPMVGSVIVKDDAIIGQGFHEFYGGPHAEVNAISNIEDQSLIEGSTLYVNLEPCAHHGKTPPCSDLIIKHKIAKVVIGCVDSFHAVSGKGIEKLKKAGIEVVVGALERKSLELNKRFFTYHSKKRPYIILKWAQTSDGFIDIDRNQNSCHPELVEGKGRKQKEIAGQARNDDKKDNWITTPASKTLVHHWRAEEQAIMVGTNTALNDNPKLTVREIDGKNPIRIVLDMSLRLPNNIHLFDQTVPTLVFNKQKNKASKNLELIKINTDENIINQILVALYKREIQSVIIEGGAQLLTSFIEQNLWDEARVFTGKKEFATGLKSPQINKEPKFTMQIESDILNTYFND